VGLSALALAVIFTARYPIHVRARVQRLLAENARRAV
jgi:hypothetical protein